MSPNTPRVWYLFYVARGCPRDHSSTTPRHPVSGITHACNVIALLEKHFLSYEQFLQFWGQDLVVERAGNGDRWFHMSQVETFINHQLNA